MHVAWRVHWFAVPLQTTCVVPQYCLLPMLPVVLLERINQGEPVAAQDAIRTTDQMEHPIEEPQIEAANVSPLLMSRLLGWGRPRSAPIQLGEGHQASARTSIQSEDQIDFIWSLRDHASPGKR